MSSARQMAIPRNRIPGKAILYTHGGAYVYGSPSTHEAVSYTHLDVYKRQQLESLSVRRAWIEI